MARKKAGVRIKRTKFKVTYLVPGGHDGESASVGPETMDRLPRRGKKIELDGYDALYVGPIITHHGDTGRGWGVYGGTLWIPATVVLIPIKGN